MADSENALISDEKRDEHGRFIVPPKSPGRPVGARNKLGEAFLEALHDDFIAHGASAIIETRTDKPDQYLKVIASILPREMTLNLNDNKELTDDELIERIRHLQSVIAPFLADGTGDAEGLVGKPARAKQSGRVH